MIFDFFTNTGKYVFQNIENIACEMVDSAKNIGTEAQITDFKQRNDNHIEKIGSFMAKQMDLIIELAYEF